MEVNATAAALLGLLRDGPQTGYALVQRAEQQLGDYWTVTRSQVYRELAAMASRGLLTAEEAGARDARPYRLTDDGRAAFRAWMHADPGPDVVRLPLLLRMAFLDELEPERLQELVAQQRAGHAERLAHYEQVEQGAREAGATDRQLVTLRFGLAYERAVLGWFDEVARLTD